MRADVRQLTRDVASAELRFHDTYIALVGGPLVRELADGWSYPVQLRMIPSDTELGVVDIQARRLTKEEADAVFAEIQAQADSAATELELQAELEPVPDVVDG